MKFITYAICAAMLFSACRRGQNHDHNHEHDGHEHEHEHEHASGEIVILPEQAEAAGLQVETVQAKPFRAAIKAGGQIQAAQGGEQTVAAPSSGIVSFARTLAEGSAVKPGETLLTVSARHILDGDPAAKAKLAFEQAEREYRRASSLMQDALISAKEYEQSLARYETARLACEALDGNRTEKGVAASSAIGGYVKTRLVAEGEYVTAGQPLAIVAHNRRLQLKCNVPEKYYSLLPAIATASFKMPYGGALYRLSELNGRMVSYGRSAGDASFYIPVTFEFDNAGDIAPGAFVEVYLTAGLPDSAVSVPLEAVIEAQGLYFVYVQIDDDAYAKREVKPGDDNGQEIRILHGLAPGDRVVTRGAVRVKLAENASAVPEHSHSH